ncbi:zinc finger protein 1-like isoform X2 [Bolinopsis microptera]|uniref:zinc finger protein 1-like isoform X2 n=1 Tax=Bolinopsis microptera TaxID=2820187 RepID=UPI00307A840E
MLTEHFEFAEYYKMAIYSQLLDTIREVVTQTLDSAYGTGAPHITTEVLELALKDNLSSFVGSPEKTSIILKKERVGGEANLDPKILKMLQNNSGVQQQPDIFNQTTNQLLKLIELNSLNSDLNKTQSKPYAQFLGYPNLPLHKVNPYSSLLNQQNNLFKARETAPAAPFNPVSKPFTPPLIPSLQKQFLANEPAVGPKIFSPGVIKSEDTNRVSPSKSPQQAFHTGTETKSIFSPSSPFTSVAASKSQTISSSANSSPVSLANSLQQLQNSMSGGNRPMSSTVFTQQSHLNHPSLSLPSSLSSAALTNTTNMLLSNGSNLLNNSPATTMSNMEVHQNFIKQINLLNQTAPSMLGQKLGIAGQDKAAKDIEKVLMDIQVNMTNIKPDPWGQAKDKLYKCPHCETAFARRQYLSNHIINVHNLKTCPECKTTFSNEEAFNAHLAMHPKKEYECGSCNKSFNSVYLLKNHRKTHVKDKPFACNICGKTFADKYYLRNHFSIHSPVKPYSCPVCGRGFASSSALRYHSFQHTGEKPAKCQYCPSEFVQKNQLKLHIARKHKELINSLNPLHEGDIIPGNMSLGGCGSPAHSPAHTPSSATHQKHSPIVHSPTTQANSVQLTPSNNIMNTPTVAPAPPQQQPEEAMQVDGEQKPEPKTETPSEAPTVAMATEQLQELIASLQRSSKQGSKTTTQTTKTEKKSETPNNFTLSSPFSKITDGINQLLDGSAVAGETGPVETS